MRLLFTALLITCCGWVFGQSPVKASFNGKVINTRSLPIVGASIYLLNTNRGTVTDELGQFHLVNLVPGNYIVQVSAIGYATIDRNIEITAGNNDRLSLMLADAATQLDAVVVSAQKREELLQRVPSSITAFSARQVRQYRLWNTRDLTGVVPNLYSSNSGDDRNVTSIRGIATTSYDPAVATYIDGVNQFSLDTYIPQLLDIERIEVLRGPQGTLYGRNAMGGVINIITRQPTNDPSGFMEFNVGNKGIQRYSAGARLPIIKDKLFLGVANLYERRKGFYENAFYGNSFDKQERSAGNYYLKYIPNTKWSISLNAKHQDARNNGAFPLVNGVEEAFSNPFVLNQDAVARMIDHTFNGSLVVNYAGTGFNFSSQTAYQANHRYYEGPLDGDFSPIDGVSIINNYGDGWNKVKVWTQEFKLSSPAVSSSNLHWTTGLYFFHQDNPNKQAIYFGDDAALVGAPDVNFSLISTTKGQSSGLAAYGQASYNVTDKWSIIAGLRFDREHKRYNVLGEYQKDPDPNPQFETRPDTSASVSFSAVSPKLGLSYEWSTAHHLFLTYSRGYRTGGLTQLSSDPTQPPLYPYKPEYSNNIELGLKNTFLDNKLRLNFTLFYTTVTDAQVPTLVLPDAITITRNAAKLDSKGAELELSAAPAKGLIVDYNFGYTDASYKNLKLSQNGSSVDLEGKKQIFTPEATSMLAVQYSYAIGRAKKTALVARGEWIYLGRQYFDLSNAISQKGYGLINARLGVALPFGEIMLWARNLSDKKYIAYAYDFGAIHLGNPRTFGITVSTQIGKK